MAYEIQTDGPLYREMCRNRPNFSCSASGFAQAYIVLRSVLFVVCASVSVRVVQLLGPNRFQSENSTTNLGRIEEAGALARRIGAAIIRCNCAELSKS